MRTLKKTFQAHAKVNFCLHVLGRRPDGYHDVAMLMQQISLADQVMIEVSDGNDIQINCPGLKLVPGEINIAEKAARSLLSHVGESLRLKISIKKHIPAAAGMGGGSSDAATVLVGLNRMLGLDLSKQELMNLGVKLGADVPFFIFDQTAWATGIGDHLEAWPGMPPMSLVLVNPGIAVSTAWVYQNLGLTHTSSVAKLPKFPEGIPAVVRLLHNDLEAVTVQRFPVIDEIKKRLIAGGACGALMSGSGPTVFGVFSSFEKADRAAKELASHYGWWTQAARLK
ncbi:MAG: 4-(cytidine 5'-diphospho)-2-C-methyl-D-erythritol kinase [Deltaproteobacteria bacterium]|jgi:4-diphosphocytidyl-2-C-methyl-D-erythritol kinase|nr:4-(cytidine 5'-diphospho)-2-C-methyl-D-erythritol kinase [Deltaproteobacteria bacterium]MBW2519578.1 4-(cytidine 5'-diphospho)-2-C-methyl-D-erythritol kinase [Deltaproteobacteria bacterium]